MRATLMLAAAVLVAIGIGVGIEGGLGPTGLGPPEAHFTASFPGPPRPEVRRGGSFVTYAYIGTSRAHHRTLFVSVTVQPAFVPAPQDALPPPVAPVTFFLPGGRSSSERVAVHFRRTEVSGRAGLLGISCARGAGGPKCLGLVVGVVTATRHAMLHWNLRADAPTAAAVRALLSSVRLDR